MDINEFACIVNTLPKHIGKSKVVIDGREITAVVAQCDGSKVAFLTEKSKIKSLDPLFVSCIPDNEEALIRMVKATYIFENNEKE